MKTIAHLLLFTWLVILILIWMPSCAMGPDYSPDVTAHAASYGGLAPTFTPDGRMSGLAPAGPPPQRRTMFNP